MKKAASGETAFITVFLFFKTKLKMDYHSTLKIVIDLIASRRYDWSTGC